MEGSRIVMVRHGESLGQERRVVSGHRGCAGLSERGRRQAEALADRLARTGELDDASAVYTSLMPRAIETAALVAAALGGRDVVRDCDFCERHPGDEGDGLSYDEYERRWPLPDRWDPDTRRDPGSETWLEMAARVTRGLDALVARHPGETLVVVCHGGVVVQSLLRWLALDHVGGGGARAWFDPANTSLTEWRFAPNPFGVDTAAVELVRFNDRAHLAGLRQESRPVGLGR